MRLEPKLCSVIRGLGGGTGKRGNSEGFCAVICQGPILGARFSDLRGIRCLISATSGKNEAIARFAGSYQDCGDCCSNSAYFYGVC